MEQLSKKQQEIFDFICLFIKDHGYPPSVREIGEAVGLKSPSTVHFHLKSLKKHGLISQSEGKTRAISLSEEFLATKGKIPLLGYVAAGAPILAQEHIEDYIHFMPDSPDDVHFALRVRGESMRNAGILPDDLVVVKETSTAHRGDIVVALFEDEATVKSYERKNGKTWLLPQNPDFSPIDGDKAQIIGKVVAVIRRYDSH